MKRKLPRYFYLDVAGHGSLLHRRLQANYPRDTLIAWCYPLSKRVAYTYSTVRKDYEPAFTTKEVAAMMNRKPLALKRAIQRGDVVTPQFSYSLTESKKKMKYLWSEKDIMQVHEYFSNLHYGRPRKDGMITPYKMPTKREVRAMIHQEVTLWVKDSNGEFVPTWKAQDFS